MSRRVCFLVSVALISVSANSATAQMNGAAFATTRSGQVVEGSLFTSRSDVYLSGGPGPNTPCTAPGIPDGRYYFQVTNPAGTVLVSTTSLAQREVTVSAGIITGTTGNCRTGAGACGSMTVELLPDADVPRLDPSTSESFTPGIEPYAGTEYKVWLTPVDEYDMSGAGFFGFLANHSLTDNFVVLAATTSVHIDRLSTILGFVFYDFNENGVWDPSIPEEVPIPGWRVEIYRNGLLDGVTFTNVNGGYEFIRFMDGTPYDIVAVAPPPGYVPTPNAIWLPTTPTQGTVTASTLHVTGPDFGSVSFRQALGVGRTKGFWHNAGQPLLLQCDPLWRDALNGPAGNPLCLRRNDGTIFTVPTGPFALAFTAWQDFVLDSANGVAAFILSSQVGPAVLNNTCGFMQGSIYVDRNKNGVLVSLQVMLQEVRVLLCDSRASQTGPQTPYKTLRAAILACAQEFESINETGELSEPQVVYKSTEMAVEFPSPYGPK